jgi:hypothetical protein
MERMQHLSLSKLYEKQVHEHSSRVFPKRYCNLGTPVECRKNLEQCSPLNVLSRIVRIL